MIKVFPKKNNMKIRLFVRLLVAVTFLMNTIAAQNPKKISWSVVAGGQFSDMNYGLNVVESLIGENSAFINYSASGKPAPGWFAGLGVLYSLHESVQLGIDVTYSLNRNSIEGENSDLRSNAPILPPPGYPIRLRGLMRYSFAGAGIYGQYFFKNRHKKTFCLKPLLQFHMLADYQWTADITYEDNSVQKTESRGNIEKPELNNLWWAGIELGFHFTLNERLYLHPCLGFHQALNNLHTDSILPQNLTFSLRLSGM